MFTTSAYCPVGDDIIFSAQSLNVSQRVKPADGWSAPAGSTALASGSNWGAYIQGDTLIWPGQAGVDDAPHVNDAGAEDGRVYAGLGSDYIEGGLSQDNIQGGGAGTSLTGENGEDFIAGESYNATDLAGTLHGGDFIDGGAGNDSIAGAGYEIYGRLGDDISEATPYSIAAYVLYSRATTRFASESRCCKEHERQLQRSVKRSSTKTSYARSARLAGHKGLGRRMGVAWANLLAMRLIALHLGGHSVYSCQSEVSLPTISCVATS